MLLFHIFDAVKYLVLNFNLRRTQNDKTTTNIITTKRLLLSPICILSCMSKRLYPAAATNIQHPNMNIGSAFTQLHRSVQQVLHSVLTHNNSPKSLEVLSTMVSNQHYWASILSWKDSKLWI